jgi:DNA-directed RNA polymerase specialized sigma24 family protein
MHGWGSLSGHYEAFLSTAAAGREFRRLVERGRVPPSAASPALVAAHLRAVPRDQVDTRLPGLVRAIGDADARSTAWALLWFLLEADLIVLFERRRRDLWALPVDLEAHIVVALLGAMPRAGGATRIALLAAIAAGLRGDRAWCRKRWLTAAAVADEPLVAVPDLATALGLRAHLAQLPEAEHQALYQVVILGASRVAASRALGISRHDLSRRLARGLRQLQQRHAASCATRF